MNPNLGKSSSIHVADIFLKTVNVMFYFKIIRIRVISTCYSKLEMDDEI